VRPNKKKGWAVFSRPSCTFPTTYFGGLPIIALGDRVSSIKYFPLVALASGLGGAFILFVPDVLIRITDRKHQYAWSRADWGWPGIAFAIAAATALMYCILLRNSHASEGGSGDERLV
jgi:hypothetical protein